MNETTNSGILKQVWEPEPNNKPIIMVPDCKGMSAVQRAAYDVVSIWLSYRTNIGQMAGWLDKLKEKGILVPEVRKNRRGYGVSFTFQEMHHTTNVKIEDVVRVTFLYATREQKGRRTK
jgi:protein-L-isoaspartate O-methyltransferase